MARVRVGDELGGRRVDHGVDGAVDGLTMAGARRLIAAGAVRVDGRVARKGDRVSSGQTVDVDDAAVRAGAPRVEPDGTVAGGWLYVDDALVAIDKPAGVPSHPLRAGERGTAANALVARFPECATASADAREGGLGHRLDNETSGVLLAARSRAAWEALRAELGAPTCEKTYLAEILGASPDAGVEVAPIGRTGRRGARVRVAAAASRSRRARRGRSSSGGARRRCCARGCTPAGRTRCGRTWRRPGSPSWATRSTARARRRPGILRAASSGCGCTPTRSRSATP